MIDKIGKSILTIFGVGYFKYAPGTIASFFACVIFLLFINIANITVIFFITLLIFCYSIIAINNSFELFETDDPQEIVIDEVVGQMLPLLAIPIYETLCPLPSMYYYISAF